MKLIPLHYATRNLGRSPQRLVLSVGGALLVALLLMAGAGFAQGMQQALQASGHERNVLLLGAGSEESLERSEIPRSVADSVGASVRGVGTWDGRLLASPEIHVALPLGDASSDGDTDAGSRAGLIRGITPMAFLLHSQVRMLAGRAPESGSSEVIIGASAARAAGIDPAALERALEESESSPGAPTSPTITVDGSAMRIVGLFHAPGTVLDGEVWMPIDDLIVLTKRETVSGVVLGLAPGASVSDAEVFAQRRIDLELSAIHEPAYYAAQSAFYLPVRILVLVSAGLVAAGALIGGLNTLYAAFASRIRELAMLQVIGFSRSAVVISMMQESLIASLSGALIAVVLALLFVDGIAVQFSMGVFGITIDQRIIALGILSGVVVGIVGTIAPAIRCLSTPLPPALKSD
jgi:putative ABC transport system permease protein